MGGVHTLPENDKSSLENFEFYSGKITCKPDRVSIDQIHKKWTGDYFELEANHSYIQWLFPIREGGLNWSSQPLTKNESELFKNSTELQTKIIKSYRLMLDFYGIELVDEKTGELKRAKNYQERYRHLNTSFHNYLRITRILKCLGLVGLEHLKKPLVLFFCNEIFKNDELYNAKRSLLHYWIPTIRSNKELKEIEEFVEKCGEEIDRDRYDDWDKEQTWANQRIKDLEGEEVKSETNQVKSL